MVDSQLIYMTCHVSRLVEDDTRDRILAVYNELLIYLTCHLSRLVEDELRVKAKEVERVSYTAVSFDP